MFEDAFLEPGDGPDPVRTARLRHRFARTLETDPAGAWVVEQDGAVVGVGTALLRGPLWILSLLAVRSTAHGGGHGRTLMRRTLEYGEASRGFMLCASTHPAALHVYASHGFRLLPTLAARGTVDRSRLPAAGAGVRPGAPEDLELCAVVDEAVRGGARSVDIEAMVERGAQLFVSERPRGYALVQDGRCYAVAAEDEATAQALLWTIIASAADAGGEASIEWITGEQQWAVEVVVAAGLRLAADGPVCVRGETGPLHPWLPNGALL